MARSDFSFSAVASHGVLASRGSPRRRALSSAPSTPMSPSSNASLSVLNEQNRLSSPNCRRGSAVRRSLFGPSNPDDTENMFKFVMNSKYEEFKTTYGFDVENGRPCENGALKWEQVDENRWVAKNVADSPRDSAVVKPLRPIRLDMMDQSNRLEDVEMTSVEETQRLDEVLSRVSFPIFDDLPPSSSTCTTISGKTPITNVNNNIVMGPPKSKGVVFHRRQTSISDFMTPLKRRADALKSSPKKLGAKNSPKRAKITEYFNPTA